jgi:hypothetical protein
LSCLSPVLRPVIIRDCLWRSRHHVTCRFCHGMASLNIFGFCPWRVRHLTWIKHVKIKWWNIPWYLSRGKIFFTTTVAPHESTTVLTIWWPKIVVNRRTSHINVLHHICCIVIYMSYLTSSELLLFSFDNFPGKKTFWKFNFWTPGINKCSYYNTNITSFLICSLSWTYLVAKSVFQLLGKMQSSSEQRNIYIHQQ